MNTFAVNANLSRNPELQYGQSGKAWVNFAVAYNHNKDEVSFFECKAWGQTAEFINEYFAQGDGINIEGEIRQERWEDRNGGGNRSKVVLSVRRATFPRGKKGGGDNGGERQENQQSQGSRGSQQSSRGGSRGGSRGEGYGDGGGGGFPPSDDSLGIDDIPFAPCKV